MKNAEGYNDPTAGKAISRVKKKEKADQAAGDRYIREVYKAFGAVASLIGLKIKKITLEDKETGRIYTLKAGGENDKRRTEKL